MTLRRILSIAALIALTTVAACESGGDESATESADDPQLTALQGYADAPLTPLSARGWQIELPESYQLDDKGRSFEDSAEHGPEFKVRSRGRVASVDELEADVGEMKVTGKQRQRVSREGDTVFRMVDSPSGNLRMEVHRVMDGKAVACSAKLRVDDDKPLIEAALAFTERACATVQPSDKKTGAAE